MQTKRLKKQRRILSSFEDNQNAVVEVAAVAERTLAILTPDLEPGIYDHEKFLEVVKRLVLSKRYARVRVLISDPSRTIRNGNRLVALARRLNTYIEFRNANEDYCEDHPEAFLIADNTSLLFRADARKNEGMVGINEPGIACKHLELFERIWQASEIQRELRELRI